MQMLLSFIHDRCGCGHSRSCANTEILWICSPRPPPQKERERGLHYSSLFSPTCWQGFNIYRGYKPSFIIHRYFNHCLLYDCWNKYCIIQALYQIVTQENILKLTSKYFIPFNNIKYSQLCLKVLLSVCLLSLFTYIVYK